MNHTKECLHEGNASACQICKPINDRLLRKIPLRLVEINTSEYEHAHGKAPRGYGSWAFKFCSGEVQFYQGKWSEAKKAARIKGALVGSYVVKALS